jgi:hypothetical protein
MELIDRYIYEVGRYLPRKNRADIQAELRSLLSDTLEARVKGEATEDDVVALLKEFGPPAKVAGSYRPESQYLIGPELFPFFRMIFGVVLMGLGIAYVVLFVLSLFTNPDPLKALDVLSNFIGSAFGALGVLVIVFYVLQYFDVHVDKPGHEWDPRQLPDVDVKNEVKRGGISVGMAFQLVLLVAFLAFPTYIGVVVTPGTPIITDPVLEANIPLIVAALAFGLVVDFFLLWRGRWETGTRMTKVASNLLSIVVIAVLISGHSAWLAQHSSNGFFGMLNNLPVLAPNGPEATLTIAMFAVQWALIVAMIVTVVETVETGYRLFRQLTGLDEAISMAGSLKQGSHT